MSKILVAFLVLIAFVGCDKKKALQHEGMLMPCEPLPAIDGHRFIKTEEGVNLKLPTFANIRRRHGDFGCDYMYYLGIDYLWYKGKLISEGINRFKVPQEERIVVKFHYGASGNVVDGVATTNKNTKPWSYDDPIPHKRFPLVLYPKYFWDEAHTPPENPIQAGGWGIVGTKYTNLIGKPFTAWCSIPPADESNYYSRVESDFARFGNSKCRGGVVATKNGKFLSVTIDVMAYLGADQQGIMEINHIYDAAVEKLQSFIQE